MGYSFASDQETKSAKREMLLQRLEERVERQKQGQKQGQSHDQSWIEEGHSHEQGWLELRDASASAQLVASGVSSVSAIATMTGRDLKALVETIPLEKLPLARANTLVKAAMTATEVPLRKRCSQDLLDAVDGIELSPGEKIELLTRQHAEDALEQARRRAVARRDALLRLHACDLLLDLAQAHRSYLTSNPLPPRVRNIFRRDEQPPDCSRSLCSGGFKVRARILVKTWTLPRVWDKSARTRS